MIHTIGLTISKQILFSSVSISVCGYVVLGVKRALLWFAESCDCCSYYRGLMCLTVVYLLPAVADVVVFSLAAGGCFKAVYEGFFR